MTGRAGRALLVLLAVAFGALGAAVVAHAQEGAEPAAAEEITVTEVVEGVTRVEVPLPGYDAAKQQGADDRPARPAPRSPGREAREPVAPLAVAAPPAAAYPGSGAEPSDAERATGRETTEETPDAKAQDEEAVSDDARSDAARSEDAGAAAGADAGAAAGGGESAPPAGGDGSGAEPYEAWSDPSEVLATAIMAFVLMEILAAGAALGATRGLVTVPGGVSTDDLRDAASRAVRAARDAARDGAREGSGAGSGAGHGNGIGAGGAAAAAPAVTGAGIAAAIALAAGTRRRPTGDDEEADDGAARGPDTDEEEEASAGGEVAWAPASELAAAGTMVAIGDRSRTWRWPGTGRWAAWTRVTPPRIAMRSPLVARILADAGYLRAMLGSISLLTIPIGVVLGIAAVADVGGEALPPALALMIAIAVLGVADAAAGATAALVFAVGVAALGGIDSAAAVRTLLGVIGVWVTVPLIAGDERPLRRTTRRLAADVYDRLGDIAIAALICAWVVQGIVGSLGGLAERELSITASADTMAWVVIGALVVRFLLESVALAAYPKRLEAVSPDLPVASTRTMLAAAAVRTGLFVLLAVAVIGWSWQLAVGTLLIVIRQLVDVYGGPVERLAPLGRVIPGGITKVVVMLFVGGIYAKFALDALEGSGDPVRDAFVVLALPGFVLGVLGTLAGTMRVPLTWPIRLAGLAVLVVGVLQVQGHLIQF